MAGPIFSHIRNPYPAFPGGAQYFHRRLYPGLGPPHGGFPDLGYLDPFRMHAPHQGFGAQGGNAGRPSLGHQYCMARHIPGCLNVIADRLSQSNQPITTEWHLHPEIVNQIFKMWGIPAVNMFATCPQHAPSPVYIPNSGASSTGDRCSVTGLAGKVDINVSTVSTAQQSHSEAQDHLIAPWWPSPPWFPHLLCLCVDHPGFK